jgi:hypothetical protein
LLLAVESERRSGGGVEEERWWSNNREKGWNKVKRKNRPKINEIHIQRRWAGV